MKKLFYSTSRKNRTRLLGVAIPEFAIGFPIIVLLIVFFVDTGLYLFQRSMLTDATAAMTRRLSTSLGQMESDTRAAGSDKRQTAADCDQLKNIAKATYNSSYSARANLHKDMWFEMGMEPAAALVPYRLITVRGSATFNCITCKFVSNFIPLTIQHLGVLAIERPTAGKCAGMNVSDGTNCISQGYKSCS